jgi:hypothetical protein
LNCANITADFHAIGGVAGVDCVLLQIKSNIVADNLCRKTRLVTSMRQEDIRIVNPDIVLKAVIAAFIEQYCLVVLGRQYTADRLLRMGGLMRH